MTPGRFVGAEDELDDDILFEEKFAKLKKDLENEFRNGRELEGKIAKVLSLVGSND